MATHFEGAERKELTQSSTSSENIPQIEGEIKIHIDGEKLRKFVTNRSILSKCLKAIL
jgi:hypothetical protein